MMGLSARLLFLALTATAFVPALGAQVGITSGLTQVALVARSAPRGSIRSIGFPSERPIGGGFREVSVPVQVSANTSYRLLVSRIPPSPTSGHAVQLWVRAENGEFKAVEWGFPVVVARGRYEARERNLEIVYRLQANGQAPALPVRYEIAISPQL